MTGCLVTVTVKSTKQRVVTARSNMPTDEVNWVYLFCCVLLLICPPILWEVTSFSSKKRATALVKLSSTILFLATYAFPLSFDWVRIWPPHFPAPWTGLPQTRLPPCLWLTKCRNHCWVEAGAHLRGETERQFFIEWQTRCTVNPSRKVELFVLMPLTHKLWPLTMH